MPLPAFAKVSFAQTRQGQVVLSAGTGGVEFISATIVKLHLVPPAQREQGVAEIGVSCGVVWLQLESSTVALLRLCGAALLEQRIAEAVVMLGVLRSWFDQTAKTLLSSL